MGRTFPTGVGAPILLEGLQITREGTTAPRNPSGPDRPHSVVSGRSVVVADEANHFHPSRPNCSAGMPLARRGARAPPCHRCPRSRARRRGRRRGARAAGWRARAAPAARWARAASALRRRGPGPRSGREVGVPHRPGAERHHCFGRLGRQVRDDRDRFDQLEEAAGGGVRHPRTGRRHAGAPSGGCSSTRGLYSTSWMRPSKVRCSIISRATSG
jgi:hypothetical protein